jgi:cephalosporin hydroxylase
LDYKNFPQDLWIYEQLIWEVKPSIIFEVGVNNGGFTLWLAERLRSLKLYADYQNLQTGSSPSNPKVVGIDLDLSKAIYNVSLHSDLASYICLEYANAADASQLEILARKYVSREDRILVIEDSAHVYETTRATLTALAPFVSKGSFLIVEDGCVDYEHLRQSRDWPRGVSCAIDEFLLTHPDFVQDTIGDRYTITCHPGGYLRRVA